MVLAEDGARPAARGGHPGRRALAAGGANAANMVIDRDIDRLMPRTQGRPLVVGLVTPREAVVFASVLEVAAFAVPLVAGQPTVGRLGPRRHGVLRRRLHDLVEAHLHPEHRHRRCGRRAVPVLIGWTAVTGGLAWPAIVLFVVIFLWTPPHFWALAIRYADDYRAAGVPMLPAVAPAEQVGRRMLAYTVALWASTLVLVPVADLRWIYGVTALVLGAIFAAGCVGLVRDPTRDGRCRSSRSRSRTSRSSSAPWPPTSWCAPDGEPAAPAEGPPGFRGRSEAVGNVPRTSTLTSASGTPDPRREGA